MAILSMKHLQKAANDPEKLFLIHPMRADHLKITTNGRREDYD
jgi:hypothetical protein